MLSGIMTLLVIKVNGAIHRHYFQEHQQETFSHPQFLHLYTFFPFIFFSNVTFHLKTYFKVIGFIVSSKRTIPEGDSPYQPSGPSHWRTHLTAGSYFSIKFLLMARKIRVAGEEHQHWSHCVAIRDQDSLHMPTSLDKRPRPASTRCCNGATGDAQPFKERAKKRHFKNTV